MTEETSFVERHIGSDIRNELTGAQDSSSSGPYKDVSQAQKVDNAQPTGASLKAQKEHQALNDGDISGTLKESARQEREKLDNVALREL